MNFIQCKKFMVIILISWAFVILCITATESEIQEYCLKSASESFEVTCLKNEVIIMSYAVYGRMRIGKCLQGEREVLEALGNNQNFLGCSVNILAFIDGKCSGRNYCEIKSNDDDLLKQNPCHTAFKSYLEASHECGYVLEEDRSCSVHVTSDKQYIKPSSSTSNCGSRLQPWKLEAPVGQQINISLLDFEAESMSAKCKSRGYVLETDTKKNVSVCSQNGNRMSTIFISQSNEIQLILFKQPGEYDQQRTSYLIQIAAIGCSNVMPPVDAWLRRDGNIAVVGCYTSRQSWTLRCVGNHWIGVIGNCTRDFPELDQNDNSNGVKSVPANRSKEVVVIASIIAVGLIICASIICIGIVCWKRYNHQIKGYPKYDNHHNTSNMTKGYSLNHQPLVSTS